jgi:hypothetical protein
MAQLSAHRVWSHWRALVKRPQPSRAVRVAQRPRVELAPWPASPDCNAVQHLPNLHQPGKATLDQSADALDAFTGPGWKRLTKVAQAQSFFSELLRGI